MELFALWMTVIFLVLSLMTIVLKKWKLTVALVIAALAGVAGVTIQHVLNQRDRAEQAAEKAKAEKREYLNTDTVLPIVGDYDPIWICGEWIRNDIGLRGTEINMWPGVMVIRVDHDSRLLLNGDIRDDSGLVLCRVVDSGLNFLPGAVAELDMNSSLDAVEVVDAEMHPVIQIFWSKGEGWRVNFALYDEFGKAAVCTYEVMSDSADPIHVPAGRMQMQRIFEYPGQMYPGMQRRR